MNLKEQLNSDLRDALRAGDELKKSTLRMLLAAVRNAEIPPEITDPTTVHANSAPMRTELDDAGVLEIVRRQVKQRRDSIDAFQAANRNDLVAKEEAEIGVLATYLPAQMSRDEIETVARAVIERVGATGPADKGKVMPAVIAELSGRAEGREINAVVTELLSQSN